MAEQIALDGFTRALTRVFGESFERAEGFYLDRGTSLFETLETVSAHEASRPVSAGCAPIAAQVDHICFFLDLTGRMARGENPGQVDWSASWRRTGVTDEEWSALQGRLRDEYDKLLALARDPATWGDENAIFGALTLVAHVAFHLGQIREALCVVRGQDKAMVRDKSAYRASGSTASGMAPSSNRMPCRKSSPTLRTDVGSRSPKSTVTSAGFSGNWLQSSA